MAQHETYNENGQTLMEFDYRGPERRFRQRREINDRREMIRFEPDKTPRRSGRDRRLASEIWKYRK